MSIDRYIAVCQTFATGLQKLRTQKSASIITILLWSIALLFCIPAMMYSHKVGTEPHCLCMYVTILESDVTVSQVFICIFLNF